MYKLCIAIMLLIVVAGAADSGMVRNYYLAAKVTPLEHERLLDSARQNSWQVECDEGPPYCSHCLLRTNSASDLFFYLLELPDYDSVFVYTNDLRQKDSLLRFLKTITVKGVK